MAGALRRLLEDDDLRRRLASAAGAEVELRFTPEAYCRSLIRFYQETLASARNART
jgi:glycosyltransferase involved in cell wall biosynthesis